MKEKVEHVLVVGKGAREDAICRMIKAQRPGCRIFCAPGSDGISRVAEVLPEFRLDIPLSRLSELWAEIQKLRKWAVQQEIDLVIVGPEDPLAAGIVDAFQASRLLVFGPTGAAAQLEWDKGFAKMLCWRCGIPTAPGEVILHPTEAGALDAGRRWRDKQGRVVIKPGGLTAGKGARIAKTTDESRAAVHDMLVARIYGDDVVEGIVVEEFMDGEEASLLVICDGEDGVPLVPAQDHKAIGRLVAPGIGEGDEGLNTGGMGAYAPAPVMTQPLIAETMETIVRPALAEMRRLGAPYRGVLYVGLMITADGPRVVEFNCRFGDPEAQVVLPLLESDLVDLCLAAARGKLYEAGPVRLATDRAAACVVKVSGGYPGSYEKGKPISGLEELDGCDNTTVFHAGTSLEGETWKTAGGRVLAVTAHATDIPGALISAYRGVQRVSFEGSYYRRDIGHRALERLGASVEGL